MWSTVHRLVLVWLLGLLSSSAFAQQTSIQIVLANPATNDPVSVRQSGVWPNACAPKSPRMTITGNQIRIATSNPGVICLTQVTPWDLTASIGRLAVRVYEVGVTYNGKTIGSTSFAAAGTGRRPRVRS
jgi:hypothetical protein